MRSWYVELIKTFILITNYFGCITLRLSRAWKRERRRSGRCKASAAAGCWALFCRHHLAERSLERWSHHFHVVLFHERAVCLRIHTLPFLEHLLKPPWCHADQQHARLRPDVLEGVRGPARDEHHGLRGRAHDAVTEFDLELPAHDVEELVLGLVNVGGRPALGCDGLTKHTQCSSGL